MKRVIILSIALLLAVTGVSAQSIEAYSTWWDGRNLYTMVQQEGNRYRFDGIDEFGSSFSLHFILVESDNPGEYVLIGHHVDDLPIDPRVEYTAKVNLVKAEGEEYLIVRRIQTGDACYALRKTRKSIDAIVLEENIFDATPFEYVYNQKLVNPEYLRRYNKEGLRRMRNEVLAHHGYRFQSKDLQEYFGGKSWYKPGDDNRSIRLSKVEQLNVELINSEEVLGDFFRQEGDADQSHFVSPNANGEIVVSSTEEFIANLGSNRKIIIPKSVVPRLNEVLADEETYAGIASFLRAVRGGGEPGLVRRESIGNGEYRLVVKDMSGLTICDGTRKPVYISGTTAYITQDGSALRIRKASDEANSCYQFDGSLDGAVKFQIVWEETSGRLAAGRIKYANASEPSPYLLVGYHYVHPDGQREVYLTEYTADGTVNGHLSLTFEMAEGEYTLLEGSWTNAKSEYAREVTVNGKKGVVNCAPRMFPAWYGESPLTPESPDNIGTRYGYKEWNVREQAMTGGHISFRGAGKEKVHFECVNAPNNVAEGKSQPGRPAVLHDNQFDYTDVNECGYSFRATFYKPFVYVESTSGPLGASCFGMGVSFDGTYIKTKD